jgi:hypothetical protein
VGAPFDDELINNFLDHLRRKAEFTARALSEVSQFFLGDALWTALGGLDGDLVAVVPDRIDRVNKHDKALVASLTRKLKDLHCFAAIGVRSCSLLFDVVFRRFFKLVYGTANRPSRHLHASRAPV